MKKPVVIGVIAVVAIAVLVILVATMKKPAEDDTGTAMEPGYDAREEMSASDDQYEADSELTQAGAGATTEEDRPETKTSEATQEVSAEGEVVLDLELPEALFIGTPEEVTSENLDPKRGDDWKRPPFMVPAGTRNLSAGKPVTSSDPMPIIGELELVTDGDKDAGEGYYVELGPGKQWVQIDLGKTYEIYAIAVWHYHSMARIYHDVVVQVSNDENFEEGVKTVFNNDRDNSSGFGAGEDYEFVESNQGELIDAGGVEGRYVRLYSNGNTANDMNHYTEVEIYGK